MNIYIDVYFCLNFLMDFVVLLITGLIIKSNKPRYRMVPAAALGAIYAVLILLSGMKGALTSLLTYLVVAVLMIDISFGFSNVKRMFHSILMLYFVTFLLGGMINAFYYGTNFAKNLVELACMNLFGNISIIFILSIVIVVLCILGLVKDKIRKNITMARHIFPVCIKIKEKQITVEALCDTGNSLYDPMTKKPVSVLEERCLKPFDTGNLKYLMIPYHTVGKKNGLMKAFIADSMKVNEKQITNAIIGIHEGVLSQSKKYQMILHPDIIENKES